MKIGLVGAGFIGSTHLEAYAKIPEAEMVGVADARFETAVAAAGASGSTPYRSYEELVAEEDVDVVDICLPTTFHREVALKAARDGKYVILEKPIARSLEDAEAILEAFSDNPERLFVGHVVRFFPEYARLKNLVDRGVLGEVGVIRTSRKSPFLSGWNDWYADWQSSGGPIVDLLIHDFDFLRWSFGEVERVYARSALGRQYGRLDYALVTLRFAKGAIAHVEGHWGYPAPFCYAIEVAGSRALITIDSTKHSPLTVLVAGRGGEDGGESPDRRVGKSPFQVELEHFLACVRTGQRPAVSGEDAREALRIGLAAAQSAASGKPVNLR